METIKRHDDSIDKLTSLMNKLDIKLDRREAQYRPKIFQSRNRGCRQRQDRYRFRDISYSRKCSQYNNNRGRRNYNNNYNDRNYKSNYKDNSRSRNRNSYGDGYIRNDKYDSRPKYRRDNFRQNYGNQGYRNRSVS